MVNEAALRAVRENRKFVVQSDLEESIEVVIAGYQKKNRVLSTKEKLIVAYHEIGHALVAATFWSVSAAPTSIRVRASASAAMTPCTLWLMAAFISSALAVTASAALSSSK